MYGTLSNPAATCGKPLSKKKRKTIDFHRVADLMWAIGVRVTTIFEKNGLPLFYAGCFEESIFAAVQILIAT